MPPGVIDAVAAKTGRPVNDPDGKWMTLETNLRHGKNDLDQWSASAVFHTELDGFDWRNIVSYRKMDNLLYVDLDGSAADPLPSLPGSTAASAQL
ncbi:MAG: hypothetical protein IPP18_11980 [Rhodocyclaceae bacterium]|nr:hypothetical protein [Rhodocyclaceae bacterium]